MSIYFLNKDQVERAKEYGYTIYMCPNTRQPILGSSMGDNKVMCGCRQGNPNAPEGVQRIERDTHTHFVQYLKEIV